MGIRCFFGHKWKIHSVENYTDISYSKEGALSHIIYRYCKICKKTDSVLSYRGGHLSKKIIEELTKD